MIARIPLRPFIRAVREPFIIAFSTASSEAALPLALENMELMGVPAHIVAFVLPTGYSFNLDGSTLYLSLASHLRGASRGRPHGAQPAAADDADADADQQRSGRRAARVAGDPGRNARVRSACRSQASRCCWAPTR